MKDKGTLKYLHNGRERALCAHHAQSARKRGEKLILIKERRDAERQGGADGSFYVGEISSPVNGNHRDSSDHNREENEDSSPNGEQGSSLR